MNANYDEDELLKKIIFKSKFEKEEASFYIKVKGIATHEKIIEHLKNNCNNNGSKKITWERVSALLKYDKKIRQKLYIYLATLEEYLRAYLSNKYENNLTENYWVDCKGRHAKVKTRIAKGESVSLVLEDIVFSVLISQINKLPPNDINEIFESSKDLKLNLEAVIDLRNAVSHHVFLFAYKFKECSVDNIKDNSLEHNIKNLRQLLPTEYRYGKNSNGGITKEINRCKFQKTNENMNLDSNDIIQLN